MSSNARVQLAAQEKAFGNLLTQCLDLHSGDDILVIHDESLGPFRESLVQQLCELRVAPTFLDVPKPYQHHLVGHRHSNGSELSAVRLPPSTAAAISEATRILNVLDGELSTAPVRQAVLQVPRRDGGRLAHVPGISSDILEVVSRSSFERIDALCETLAWVMGESRQLTIGTVDRRGRSYSLQCDLEGWDNEPLQSPGRIPANSWGNIPPAEVFCCPLPSGVSGTICINGSVPGYVLDRDDEVVLHFEGGRLLHWESQHESPALRFFEVQQVAAAGRGDANWNVFAELGVGANPSITALTGNSLFDEKALKTIHIAIGSNQVWDHDIRSDIHADLVTWYPTIVSDDFEIMAEGEIRERAIAARRDNLLNTVPLVETDAVLAPNEAKAESVDGRLYRRLRKAKRRGRVPIGSDAVSQAACSLFDEILAQGHISERAFVQAQPVWRDMPTGRLLAVLKHYRMLRERNQRRDPR